MNDFEHFSHFQDEENIYEKDQRPSNQHPETKVVYQKVSPSKWWIVAVLVVALIGGFIGNALFGLTMGQTEVPVTEEESVTDEVVNEKAEAPGLPEPDEKGIVATVASKVLPAVVGISLDQTVTENFLFQEYQYEVQVTGSGVVVSPEGYILTNSHVVGTNKDKEVDVLFEDGSTLPAQILWTDPGQDLAVIKVEPEEPLAYAEMGNSDNLVIGERAIAIGNPLGLDFQRSVTAGYVSGLNRSLVVQGNEMNNMIQTDASINKGNSGGPLLNANGEVIGINTVKVGDGEGMGFSIPINTAKSVVNQIIETGKYEPAVLGIDGRDVAFVEARLNIELPVDHGVFVIQAFEGSGAGNAGLQFNDIITAIDGEEVTSMSDLRDKLFHYQVNDEITMTVVRGDEEFDVDVKLISYSFPNNQ